MAVVILAFDIKRHADSISALPHRLAVKKCGAMGAKFFARIRPSPAQPNFEKFLDADDEIFVMRNLNAQEKTTVRTALNWFGTSCMTFELS
jgi:hypothetical protein